MKISCPKCRELLVVPDSIMGGYMICRVCGAGFDVPEPPPMFFSGGVSPAGAHLRCYFCGYTVEGLRENRCPECGRRFDPDFLREHQDHQPERPLEMLIMVSALTFIGLLVFCALSGFLIM